MYDVTGAQPDYKLELKKEITVNESEIVLGELTVENSFPLSRNIELPDYDGCIAYNQSMRDGIYIRLGDEKMIAGGESKHYKLEDQIKLRSRGEKKLGDTIRDREIITGNYTIKTGECPERPENKTIYINSGEALATKGGIPETK